MSINKFVPFEYEGDLRLLDIDDEQRIQVSRKGSELLIDLVARKIVNLYPSSYLPDNFISDDSTKMPR